MKRERRWSTRPLRPKCLGDQFSNSPSDVAACARRRSAEAAIDASATRSDGTFGRREGERLRESRAWRTSRPLQAGIAARLPLNRQSGNGRAGIIAVLRTVQIADIDAASDSECATAQRIGTVRSRLAVRAACLMLLMRKDEYAGRRASRASAGRKPAFHATIRLSFASGLRRPGCHRHGECAAAGSVAPAHRRIWLARYLTS